MEAIEGLVGIVGCTVVNLRLNVNRSNAMNLAYGLDLLAYCF